QSCCDFSCCPFLLVLFRRRPGSTLFPYTTLFRSRALSRLRVRRGKAATAAAGVGRRVPECERGVGHVQRGGGGLRHAGARFGQRSEEHTSELQSRFELVCRLLLEKKKRLDTHRQR